MAEQFQYPQASTPVLAPGFPVPGVAWRSVFPEAAGVAAARPPATSHVVSSLTSSLPLLNPLAWKATAPDSARAESMPAAAQPAFATGVSRSTFPIAAPLTWRATFPDRAISNETHPSVMPAAVLHPGVLVGRTIVFSNSGGLVGGGGRRVQYQQFARPPSLLRYSDAATAQWLPTYPDRARAAEPLVPTGHTAGSMPSMFPTVVSTAGWQPTYPSQVPTRALAAESFSARSFVLNVPTVPMLSWRPTYADRVNPVLQIVRDTGLYQFAVVAGTPLMWAPQYPALVLGPLVGATTPATTTPPRTTVAVIGPVSWQGAFPARLDVPRFAFETLRTFAMDPLPRSTVVPVRAWAGVYPDGVDRAALPASAMPAFTTGSGAPTFQIPGLAWLGGWADGVDRLVLLTADQPTWSGPTQVIATPAPVRAWASSWPDQVWPAAGLTIAAHPAAFALLRSALPAPALAWDGVFPDIARGLDPLPPGDVLFLGESTLAASTVPFLSWLARYADWVDPVARVIAPPFFAFWHFPLPNPLVALLPDPAWICIVGPDVWIVAVPPDDWTVEVS